MQIEPQNAKSKYSRPVYLYVGCFMHFVCFVFCLTGAFLTWYDFWNEDTAYDCQEEEGTSASCFQDFEYHGLFKFQVDLNHTITTYQFQDVEDQDVREGLIACGNTVLGFACVSIFLLFWNRILRFDQTKHQSSHIFGLLVSSSNLLGISSAHYGAMGWLVSNRRITSVMRILQKVPWKWTDTAYRGCRPMFFDVGVHVLLQRKKEPYR